jgi:Glycosyl transferase family 2
MTVSVVIPSRGTGPLLRRAVGNMLRCAARTGTDAEVLVVVNGRSRAPALERLDSPLLRVVFLDRPNLARARNVGIEQARHDTVLFGDDGAACPDSWCTDLADALRDPRFPVVTAPVRVPVRGPVTAFLDYQRFFDAPPVDATEAGTVTGNCGLRRDRVPGSVRFDEVNTPMVAEDVAFGHVARAAGIRIRWLAGAAPGLHVLPERIDEVTGRLMHYGRGAARLWLRGGAPAPQPPAVLALYRYLVSGRYTVFRRFREIGPPGLRAAFALYDCLLDAAFLIGYLDEVGTAIGQPVVEVAPDGLRELFRDTAARLDPAVPDRIELPPDVRPVDGTAPTDDPLVTEVLARLPAFARLLPGEPPPELNRPAATGAPARPDRLLDAWRARCGAGRPVTPDEFDRLARGAGFSYRDAGVAIERAAARG